jgi:hypothetical protein
MGGKGEQLVSGPGKRGRSIKNGAPILAEAITHHRLWWFAPGQCLADALEWPGRRIGETWFGSRVRHTG